MEEKVKTFKDMKYGELFTLHCVIFSISSGNKVYQELVVSKNRANNGVDRITIVRINKTLTTSKDDNIYVSNKLALNSTDWFDADKIGMSDKNYATSILQYHNGEYRIVCLAMTIKDLNKEVRKTYGTLIRRIRRINQLLKNVK